METQNLETQNLEAETTSKRKRCCGFCGNSDHTITNCTFEGAEVEREKRAKKKTKLWKMPKELMEKLKDEITPFDIITYDALRYIFEFMSPKDLIFFGIAFPKYQKSLTPTINNLLPDWKAKLFSTFINTLKRGDKCFECLSKVSKRSTISKLYREKFEIKDIWICHGCAIKKTISAWDCEAYCKNFSYQPSSFYSDKEMLAFDADPKDVDGGLRIWKVDISKLEKLAESVEEYNSKYLELYSNFRKSALNLEEQYYETNAK